MVLAAGEQTEIIHLAFLTPVFFIPNLSEHHAFGHVTEAERRSAVLRHACRRNPVINFIFKVAVVKMRNTR